MKRDALALLKADHQTVKQLFRKYESLGDRANAQKMELSRRIIKELSVHAAVEEQLFYPALKPLTDDLKDKVLEALEEHSVAKWELAAIEKMKPTDERFDAKMAVMMENVLHHAEEEETAMFPAVRRAMSKGALDAMGVAIAKAKGLMPTHPHPRAPDEPPGNLIAGAMAKVMDTGRDMFAGRKMRPMITSARMASAKKSVKRVQRQVTRSVNQNLKKVQKAGKRLQRKATGR